MSDIPLVIPTIEERRRWWLLCYSVTAMERAKATCDLIQSHCGDEVTPMFEALSVAAHTYYARPFVKSFGAGRLEDDIVPPDRRGIHAWLTSFRSQTMAHTDATHDEIAGMPLNDVVYYRESGRAIFATLLSVASVEDYAAASQHCSAMLDVFKTHLREFHLKYEHLIPTTNGQHLLSLDADSPAFIEGHHTRDRSHIRYK